MQKLRVRVLGFKEVSELAKLQTRRPPVETCDGGGDVTGRRACDVSRENNGATGLLDLLLSNLGDELGLDHHGLRRRQDTLTQNLKVPELGDVDHRGGVLVLGRLFLNFRREQRPDLVDVDGGAEELVPQLVKIVHTHLPEVARMVFVEEDAVVVHASGVSAASWVLPVLADTAVPGAHVTALLPVLLKAGRHFWISGASSRRGEKGKGTAAPSMNFDSGFGCSDLLNRKGGFGCSDLLNRKGRRRRAKEITFVPLNLTAV
nr:YGL102C-like protein [Ipomoea batatas]